MEKVMYIVLGTLFTAFVGHRYWLMRKNRDSLMDGRKELKKRALALKIRYDGKVDWDYMPGQRDAEVMNFDNQINAFIKENKGFFNKRFIKKVTEAYKQFAYIERPDPEIKDGKETKSPIPYFVQKTETLNNLIDLL